MFLPCSCVLISLLTQLLSRTSVCLMECANVTCEARLWWRRLSKRDQTQTVLITTLIIKLVAHWWIFRLHQHSENTSLVYLEISFVLLLLPRPLFILGLIKIILCYTPCTSFCFFKIFNLFSLLHLKSLRF